MGNKFCTCHESEKHGQTSVMCCNTCGLPDEDFWQRPSIEGVELYKDVEGPKLEGWPELYRWVKASERLPEISGDYYCKTFAHTKEIIWLNTGIPGWDNLFKREIAEWLEKIELPNQEEQKEMIFDIVDTGMDGLLPPMERIKRISSKYLLIQINARNAK